MTAWHHQLCSAVTGDLCCLQAVCCSCCVHVCCGCVCVLLLIFEDSTLRCFMSISVATAGGSRVVVCRVDVTLIKVTKHFCNLTTLRCTKWSLLGRGEFMARSRGNKTNLKEASESADQS